MVRRQNMADIDLKFIKRDARKTKIGNNIKASQSKSENKKSTKKK